MNECDRICVVDGLLCCRFVVSWCENTSYAVHGVHTRYTAPKNTYCNPETGVALIIPASRRSILFSLFSLILSARAIVMIIAMDSLLKERDRHNPGGDKVELKSNADAKARSEARNLITRCRRTYKKRLSALLEAPSEFWWPPSDLFVKVVVVTHSRALFLTNRFCIFWRTTSGVWSKWNEKK